jgi:hypothetical protein
MCVYLERRRQPANKCTHSMYIHTVYTFASAELYIFIERNGYGNAKVCAEFSKIFVA